MVSLNSHFQFYLRDLKRSMLPFFLKRRFQI
nr:MAG TPA: hypothetical protein [Caudoviricetes sp.]DAZ40412.1 MAG TPA: hypothetical protein [Caudoviricetes sp.]